MERNRVFGVKMLMLGSLFLLAILEGTWLYKEYQRASEVLYQEANSLFLDSVREVEDSLAQEFFFRSLSRDLSTFSDTLFMFEEDGLYIVSSEGDSLNPLDLSVPIDTGSFPNKKLIEYYQEYTSLGDSGPIHKGVFLDSAQVGKEGSLSLFVKLLDKSKGRSPQGIIPEEEILLELFTSRLDRRNGRSPADMHIIAFTVDSNKSLENLTHTYRDLASGTQYAARIPNRNLEALGSILTQILFALLVFISVSFAFGISLLYLKRHRQLAEIKDEFISNITHELKTPITTMGVALEAIDNFDLQREPAKLREYLGISRAEVNRLSVLVDKILKLSLFEQKGQGLNKEPIDLAQLTTEVLASFTPRIDQRQGKLHIEKLNPPFFIQGDKAHVKNMIINLMDNALKYSPAEVEISLRLSRQNSFCSLSISDKGKGISMAYQQRVFDKFFRVPSEEGHVVKGHGLGLNYVYQMMKAHGGSIDLESKKGIGSCFTLKFPIPHE